MCPAWGKKCAICKTPNHFAKVCNSANAHSLLEDSDDARATAFQQFYDDEHPAEMFHVEDLVSDSDAESLIAHIQFEEDNSFTDHVNINEMEEIRVKVSPFVPRPDPRQSDNVSQTGPFNP